MEVKDARIINFKDEIKKMVMTKFTYKDKKDTFLESIKFMDYMESKRNDNPNEFNMVLASLISDAYELLKWKEIIAVSFQRGEKGFLTLLDRTNSFDKIAETAISEKYSEVLLNIIYQLDYQDLPDRIGMKNSILNIPVNNLIAESDKLHFFSNIDFHSKKFIFSTNYKPQEYIDLYKSINENSQNDENEALEDYLDVIQDISLYNIRNYCKLLADMCREFIFKNVDHKNGNNIHEDFLLFLLNNYSFDRIIDYLTADFEYDRLNVATLSYSYVSSPFIDKNCEKMNSDSLPENTSRVLKKLEDGKAKFN